jgi:hypothetical protein
LDESLCFASIFIAHSAFLRTEVTGTGHKAPSFIYKNGGKRVHELKERSTRVIKLNCFQTRICYPDS